MSKLTPERIAAICVTMGYDHEETLRALQSELNLSEQEARDVLARAEEQKLPA